MPSSHWRSRIISAKSFLFIAVSYDFCVDSIKKFSIIEHNYPEVVNCYLDLDKLRSDRKKCYNSIRIFSNQTSIIVLKVAQVSIFYTEAMLHLFKRVTNTVFDQIQCKDNVKWIRVEKFGYYLYKTCLEPNSIFASVFTWEDCRRS